jgi:hypothetical protein
MSAWRYALLSVAVAALAGCGGEGPTGEKSGSGYPDRVDRVVVAPADPDPFADDFSWVAKYEEPRGAGPLSYGGAGRGGGDGRPVP